MKYILRALMAIIYIVSLKIMYVLHFISFYLAMDPNNDNGGKCTSLIQSIVHQNEAIQDFDMTPEQPVQENIPTKAVLKASVSTIKSTILGDTCQKVAIVIITLLVLLATWTSLIVAGFVFTIKYELEGSSSANSSNSLNFSDTYPETYLAIFNQFNVSIECPSNFINNESHCNLGKPFCDRWHPAGQIAIPITNIGLSILIVLGFLLGIISFISFIASTYSASNVSYAKLSTRVKKLFDSMLTPSMISLYIFAIFCIFLFLIFDMVPNPNQSYCKPFSNSRKDNILFQLYGTIFQFAIMGFFFWVNFTLLNLLLTLSFPFAFHSKYRMKVIIYTIECIIGITVPIFLSCLTLALSKGSPHRGYEYIRMIAVQAGSNSLNSLMVYYAPVVLSILSILTLTPILICKMRWNSLTIKKSIEDHPKVTSLEYRIILYSVAEFVILLTIIISLIFFIKISKSKLFAIPIHIELCTTSQSPAFYYQNNTEVRFSTALEAYNVFTNTSTSRVSKVFQDSCLRIRETNKVFPPAFYVIDGFILRILIICIFIFTLPNKANYNVWKKFFTFVFKGLPIRLKSSVKSTDLS